MCLAALVQQLGPLAAKYPNKKSSSDLDQSEPLSLFLDELETFGWSWGEEVYENKGTYEPVEYLCRKGIQYYPS